MVDKHGAPHEVPPFQRAACSKTGKGFLHVYALHLAKQGNDAAYFGMFSVRPGQQGAGIGKLLLAEAERQARDDFQCPRMDMTVIDIRDSLIEFYERRGYVRTGIHKPFPYGDERFGIPKRDDLRFEVLSKDLNS